MVDNGSGGRRRRGRAPALAGRRGACELDHNVGFTRAVNLGVRRRADGERDRPAQRRLRLRSRASSSGSRAPIDPAAGVVMAAGVMRDWRDRSLIDSAGYGARPDPARLRLPERRAALAPRRRGRPTRSARRPPPPAFDRATFLSVGGFDERLFAYWEDVDLVLRLRRLGLRCALAADALGDHEHSATLGSGSARKNYLMGYGRGYVLRKWGVLTPRRLPAVLRCARLALCAGQAVIDRNVAGVRGRVRGYRAAADARALPGRARARARRRGDRDACAAAPRAGARACGPRPADWRAALARRLSPRRHQRPVALARGRARLARRRGSARRRHPRGRATSARCSATGRG